MVVGTDLRLEYSAMHGFPALLHLRMVWASTQYNQLLRISLRIYHSSIY